MNPFRGYKSYGISYSERHRTSTQTSMKYIAYRIFIAGITPLKQLESGAIP